MTKQVQYIKQANQQANQQQAVGKLNQAQRAEVVGLVKLLSKEEVGQLVKLSYILNQFKEGKVEEVELLVEVASMDLRSLGSKELFIQAIAKHELAGVQQGMWNVVRSWLNMPEGTLKGLLATGAGRKLVEEEAMQQFALIKALYVDKVVEIKEQELAVKQAKVKAAKEAVKKVGKTNQPPEVGSDERISWFKEQLAKIKYKGLTLDFNILTDEESMEYFDATCFYAENKDVLKAEAAGNTISIHDL